MKAYVALIVAFAVLFVFILARISSLESEVVKLYEVNYELAETLNATMSAVSELSYAVSELSYATRNNSAAISKLSEKASIQEEMISNLMEKIKQKGLVNPSYSEVIQFVVEDRTDVMSYIKEMFTCSDFTNMFIKNFREKGYFSCYTEIVFEEGAHAVVAVNTTDKGLMYVEPQTDQIITSLEAGDNYCSKVDWSCNWEVKYIKHCFK